MALPEDVRTSMHDLHARQERVEDHPWGAMVSDARYPLVWDANLARVNAPASLEDVEAVAGASMQRTGGRFISIFLPDPELVGTALETDCLRAGYRKSVDLVMTCDAAPPAFDNDDVTVSELPFDDPTLAQGQWDQREPHEDFDRAVMEQLLARDAMFAEHGARWFAGWIDGALAGFCCIDRTQNGLSYLDNVTTSPALRKRGVATAVVTRAIAESRAAGSSRAWLYTDAMGGPAKLYERLGFRAVARTADFLKRVER